MKKSRFLTLALALALLMSVTTLPAAAEEPVTLTIGVQRSSVVENWDTNLQTLKIEEICGVNLEFVEFPSSNNECMQKVDLMVVAGGDELPDVLMFNLPTSVIAKYGKAGIFVDLTDLYDGVHDKNFTEQSTKSALGKEGILKYITSPDGRIYGMPYVVDAMDNEYANNRMLIYEPWLKALDLEMPTTIDELEQVLTAFKEQDANGNGDPNDEIPFTGIGLGMDFLTPFGMTDVYGIGYLVSEDGTVQYAYTSEAYKEGIKWAHKLYQAGLIDQETFTQDQTVRDAKCDDPEISRVGFGYAWSYDAIFRRWMSEYAVIEPLAGPDGVKYQQGDVNGLYSVKSNQLSITTACQYPEVVLRWADQFYTGEASIQNFWGGLGEVITANADGTYTLNNPPEGISADSWYWDRSLRDFGPKYSSLEFDTKIILDPTQGDGLKVAMDENTAQYVGPCFPELKYTAEEYNEISFLQADINSYVNTMRAKWVTEGGIDEEWDAYVAQLQAMGLEDMNAIYFSAYARDREAQ